jgi:hypothetical protein
MAAFGRESEKETKAANRKRLAAAMRLEDQNENLYCPTKSRGERQSEQ